MIDFSAPTDRLYIAFGVSATHKTSQTDTGTSCTILFDEMGDEQTDYGITSVARIVVRNDEATPERGEFFEVDGTLWQIEYKMGNKDGTNELETAVACVRNTHYGPT